MKCTRNSSAAANKVQCQDKAAIVRTEAHRNRCEHGVQVERWNGAFLDDRVVVQALCRTLWMAVTTSQLGRNVGVVVALRSAAWGAAVAVVAAVGAVGDDDDGADHCHSQRAPS